MAKIKKHQSNSSYLLLVISFVLSLILMEVGLRIFTVFPIHGELSNRIRHSILGYTLNPSSEDVDKNGFRNPYVKMSYDVAVIGDSHTQGFNVSSKDSWPQQLARILGYSAYNYGVGGYGIYQYAYLVDKAIGDKPKVILIGLYPANDIDQNASKRIAVSYINKLRKIGVTLSENAEIAQFNDEYRDRSKKGTLWLSIKNKLKSSVAIISIASWLRDQYSLNMSHYYEIGGQLVKKESVSNHQAGTDLSLPLVSNNYNNSKNIFISIKNKLYKEGIKFGVVVIPSKELVIDEWRVNRAIPDVAVYNIENERNLIKEYMEFFDQAGINSIDATTMVVKAFSDDAMEDKKFYPVDDGHPYANGYKSYAEAASRLMEGF